MPIVLWRSWRDFPPADWRWPSFSPAELACRGTGQLMIDEDALGRLQALRDLLGKPIIVLSAYRSPEHNRRVGGAKASQHLAARAFDVSMANHDPAAFETAARAVGFTGFGYYPKQNFMHIDTGPARSWGTPFPPRPVTVPVETGAPDAELEEDADRFAPEPKKPSLVEAVCKPEVLLPAAAPIGTGALKLAENSWILQAAIGAGLVLVVGAGVVWLVMRQLRVRAGD